MLQQVKNIYHLGMAVLANMRYGLPSRKLVMIGVTGTDGKTTTASMIYHILKENGVKVAMITTVGAYIGEKVYDVGFHVTTPSSFAIQQYLKKAFDEGITHVVLEVTSHALDQNRAFGIHFAVSALTNVTHEHLDYHKTYEEYVTAKAKLFRQSTVSILNADDTSYPLMKNILQSRKIITYGISSKEAQETPETLPIVTLLFGSFNTYNTLAASVVARELGISVSNIQQAVTSFVPPKGRQAIVYNDDFTVMIDFAHTPQAFHVLLPELRDITKGRLIHVFGAASKRDTTKRPLMGAESTKNADIIILTAEDPRNESVKKICKEIAGGITGVKLAESSYILQKKDKKVVYIIADRKSAIEKAIAIAKKGDMVVVTGKSHETSMNYGKGEEPWDEFEMVREAIEKKKIENRR